jgi:hypothetical protein
MIAIDVIPNRRVDVTGEAATVKIDRDKGARDMIDSLRRLRKWLLSMPGSKRVGIDVHLGMVRNLVVVSCSILMSFYLCNL